jgi:hypothetical protein
VLSCFAKIKALQLLKQIFSTTRFLILAAIPCYTELIAKEEVGIWDK